MDSVTVGIRDYRVELINRTTKHGLSLSWQAADELGTVIAHKARCVLGPERESCSGVSVWRNEDQIIVVDPHGRTLLIAPLKSAASIGYAIKAQCRKLEEYDVFEDLAFDQAILQRGGFPFGLTSNPLIQAEAGKEAAWNSDLRRYMSGKKLRQRQVGSPRARHGKHDTETSK